MEYVIKKSTYFKNSSFISGDFSFYIDSSEVLPFSQGGNISKLNNCFIFPTFLDVHVHLREPGFSYKETVLSGTKAAARGGYSAVFSMPNLNPVPDSAENIDIQRKIIERDALISVYPYASITKGQLGKELSDFESLKDKCIAFSDDGKGVQSESVMRSAMEKAKALGKIIVAHCEDNRLLNGGYIHDGEYARLHSHKGICSESEWGQIARDLRLAKETGVKYHVCHISTKESVEIIRKAKHEGVDVTCETAPHYLTLTDMDLKDEGRFKMNPPVRSAADKAALIEGLLDGTVDMIATDHAPHSAEEKSRGLKGSAMGIVGLETAFSVLYTKLVKTGILPLEKLIELMSINPRKRFSLPLTDDFCVFDLNEEYTVNPDDFLSLGRATPFEGERLFGVCRLTTHNNKIVYKNI